MRGLCEMFNIKKARYNLSDRIFRQDGYKGVTTAIADLLCKNQMS